jgi:signal transduction histidine kinase
MIENQEKSLYKLLQSLDSPPESLVISAVNLKSLVGELLDLLAQQKFKTKIWVKLPRNFSWLDEINRYQKQDNSDRIYLCSTQPASSNTSSFLSGRTVSKFVPVQLKDFSELTTESFLLVLSDRLCASIVAEREKIEQVSETSKTNSTLKILLTFDPSTIQKIAEGIERLLAPTDEVSMAAIKSELSVSLTAPPHSQLVTSLLLKQIERTQAIQTSADVAKKAESNTQKNSEILGFKDEFLSDLGRELSTSITHMKTALSLLESKKLKPEQRQRYLEILDRECERQNALIAGVQELAEIDRSTKTLSVQPVYLEEIVPGIVSTYQPLAEEKGIRLGYTIPAGFPPVFCPSPWLRQIIVNLINNSLKFTFPNGQVYVQASQIGDRLQITVRDTGVGIASEDLPKIFNSFYRGSNTERNSDRAGLGLTVVRHLVRRCGGSISVSSQVGKGSTFKILLPISSSESEKVTSDQ